MPHPVKQAIYNALIADTTLVTLLGGSGAISQSWPRQEAKYTPVDVGSNYAALANVDPPRARLSFKLILPNKDIHNPIRRDLFQLDAWSPNQELVEAIVAELETFDQKPNAITLASGRVTEVLVQRGPDLYEADTRINHTPLNLRVVWTP